MAGFFKGERNTSNGVIDADKASQPRPGVPLQKEKISALILKYHGNLTHVAAAIGSSRYAVRRRINGDELLREALDEARERLVDEIEDVFITGALGGNVNALIFFLKTRARDRGYSEIPRANVEGMTRSALEWALNKSRSPVSDLA